VWFFYAVLHCADAGVAGNVYCFIALGNVIGKGLPQCQTLYSRLSSAREITNFHMVEGHVSGFIYLSPELKTDRSRVGGGEMLLK